MTEHTTIPATHAQDAYIWKALSDWDLNEELDSHVAVKIQSAFAAEELHALIYKGEHPDTVLKQLKRNVAKAPEILQNHVKRFYLAMRLKEEAEVHGALIDLMIVLRFHGKSLAERLIKEATALISDQKANEYIEILNEKTAQRLLSLNVEHSLLVDGNTLPAVFKKRDRVS
jgi:ribosomal protein S21